MLSLVQRELRTAARNPKLHRGRIWVAAAEIVFAVMAVGFHDPLSGQRAGGFSFFWFLSICAFVFCLVEGLRKTADSISEEKREGTLGLLFLTTLRGLDIVLGKLTGALVRSLNGLLAFLPILAVTLLLGGTTGGEFWRVALSLITTLFLSLSLSLMVSSWSRERSLAGGSCLLIILMVVPVIVGEAMIQTRGNTNGEYLAALSPGRLLFLADDAAYGRAAKAFWVGAGVQVLLGLIGVVIASLVTPRVWREREQSQVSTVKARTVVKGPEAVVRRQRMLDKNPIFWLAYNQRQHRLFTWVYFSVAALLLGAGALVGFSGSGSVDNYMALFWTGLILQMLLLQVCIASQASVSIAESKRNGAMELLMSTPLKVAGILKGQWLALYKMFLPALVFFLAWCAMGTLILSAAGTFGGMQIMAAKMFLECVLGVFVMGWVGMWMGLGSKSPNRAFFKTIFVGLVLPYLIACVPNLVVQGVLILVARDKVYWNFRRFIAERFLQKEGFMLAPVSGPPPVPKPS